jgi:hypothetical protein
MPTNYRIRSRNRSVNRNSSKIFFLDLDCYLSGHVRSLRQAPVNWNDARGLEKDLAGAQIRHEIPSSFVAQSLLYRRALLLGSVGAMLDRRGGRVVLSNLCVAFGDEISSHRENLRLA